MFLTLMYLILSGDGNSYGQVNLNQGVVGRYCLDGDAFDDSPNGNFGANMGASIDTNRNERPGTAMRFNGSTNYIQIPNKGIYNSLYTYAFWFYCTDYPALNDASVMFAVGGNTADQAVMLANNLDNQFTGLLVESSFNNFNHYTIYAAGLPEKNKWHHVLVSRATDSIRLYLNGTKVSAIQSFVNPYYNGTPSGARIGARANGTHFFTGKMDDVWMYNRALSHQESIALFNYKGEFGINPGMRDTTICGNSSVVLDCNVDNATYNWSTGAKTKAISVRDTGTYWVIIKKNCVWVSDTFRVGRKGYVTLPESIDICYPDTAEIGYLTFEGQSLQWFDGSSDSSIKVHMPGQYWVMASEDHCRFYDTTIVYVHTNPHPLGADTTICGKDSVYLKSQIPNVVVTEWDNESNLDSLMIDQSGTNYLRFSYHGCTFIDSISINLIPDLLFLGNDTTLCAGQSVLLNGYHPDFTQYQWNDGSTGSSLYVSDTGIYHVSVRNDICIFQDSLKVDFINPTSVLGNDTTICAGDSAFFQISLPGSHQFLWSTGDTADYTYSYQAGLIWVNYQYHSCIFSDTAQVDRVENPINLPTDTAFCGTEPILVDAFHPDITTYQWNNGEITSSISIDSSGIFDLSVDVGTCVFKHTLKAKGALEVFDLGPDLSICPNQTILLDAGNANAQSYVWNDGSNSIGLSVISSGWYWVEYEVEGCHYRDSIFIIDVNSQLELGTDKDLCAGDTLVISAAHSGADTYLWNTGEKTESIVVRNGGLYWVQATHFGGCAFHDSVNIFLHELPEVNLGNDTLICENDYILLNAGNFESYLWSNSSNINPIQASAQGVYWVRVEDEQGCFGYDSLLLMNESIPNVFNWPDTVLCFNHEILLNARIEGTVYAYLWQDGITDSTRILSDSGYYSVQIEHLCGTFNRGIHVDFEDCESIYIPSSFTPNGDRINDNYRVYINKPKEFNLAIYTRWGQLVFETHDIKDHWDGTFQGEALPSGTYLCRVNGVNVVGQHFTHSVLIQLIR